MKHCPFCGSEAVEITENKAQGYFCACTSCHGMINVYAETKEKAIAAWNQRLEAEIKENERHIHMLQNTLPAGVVEKTLQLPRKGLKGGSHEQTD